MREAAAGSAEAAGLDALTTSWRERGLSLSELEMRSDGTLVAADRALSLAGAPTALSGPAPWEHELVAEPLALGEVLGRGGMGVVHVAEQLAVRREVAVKRLPEGAPPRALESLLKEAWVGGHLAHPNIVPLHALAMLEGSPAVVMKRIEGLRWREVIRDPSRMPAADRDDPLAWHLRVLLAVCDAVQLAHSRGVLHLDLKPDNVMVGAFGEVYVLDWGLAAGSGARAPKWLPQASAIRSVAGTPDYMAPELAMGAGDRVGEGTDVYLLGAMLHEVVTGRPPHEGDAPMQKLFRAYVSAEHDYGSEVPEALAALLRRALRRDPSARFESAVAFRSALVDFMAHRDADAYVREAEERLEVLRSLLDAGAADEVALWRAFGACRFALREARAGWPEHPRLARLSAALLSRMADWAMRAGRLDLAGAYVAELGDADPALRERIEELRREVQAREARVVALEQLAHQHDLSLGSTIRRRIAIALGGIFFAVNASMGFAERSGWVELGYREMLVTGALTALGAISYGLWKRELVFRNQVNTTFFTICLVTLAIVQGHWLAGLALEMPFIVALSLTPMLYFSAFAAMTMLVSHRFFLSPLVQVPTVVLAALLPEHVYEILGVGGGLSAALIGLGWRERDGASA